MADDEKKRRKPPGQAPNYDALKMWADIMAAPGKAMHGVMRDENGYAQGPLQALENIRAYPEFLQRGLLEMLLPLQDAKGQSLTRAAQDKIIRDRLLRLGVPQENLYDAGVRNPATRQVAYDPKGLEAPWVVRGTASAIAKAQAKADAEMMRQAYGAGPNEQFRGAVPLSDVVMSPEQAYEAFMRADRQRLDEGY